MPCPGCQGPVERHFNGNMSQYRTHLVCQHKVRLLDTIHLHASSHYIYNADQI
jgi:hypothetical protein